MLSLVKTVSLVGVFATAIAQDVFTINTPSTLVVCSLCYLNLDRRLTTLIFLLIFAMPVHITDMVGWRCTLFLEC